MSETIDTVQFPCTGSPPKSHLDPMVQALPRKTNDPTESLRSKSWDDIGKTRA